MRGNLCEDCASAAGVLDVILPLPHHSSSEVLLYSDLFTNRNVLATAFVKSLATESPMPREKTLIDREMLRETEKPDSDVEAEDRVTTEPCVKPAVWAWFEEPTITQLPFCSVLTHVALWTAMTLAWLATGTSILLAVLDSVEQISYTIPSDAGLQPL